MNYYKQGDAAKADQIRAAFKKLGYDISWPGGCANHDVINIGVERNGAKYVVAETFEYIKDIIKTHHDYKELELPVEPKFKVGDWIVSKSDKSTIYRIITLHEERREYVVEIEHKDYHESCPWIAFEDQDDYELAPKPHYDIANFQPFDKVLVRDRNDEPWRIAFYGYYNKEAHYSHFIGTYWSKQCIPYEGNEALLGTTDPCDEQYINW